jgi:hypothetical protein
LGIDGAVTSGMALHEMNEKLLSLPYYVAFVQSVLKILAPLAVLTLLAGTFKFFLSWSFAWTVTLVMPVVMQLTRGISNGILFQTSKLGELANLLETEGGFLAIGVNFDAAGAIAEDSTRMMSVILSVELGIWAALVLMVPAGGWFAGGIANRVTATVAGGILSGMMRGVAIRGSSAIARTGGSVARAGLSGGRAVTLGAVHGGRTLASRAVTFVRAPKAGGGSTGPLPGSPPASGPINPGRT